MYQQMTLSPKLGIVEISTLWHFYVKYQFCSYLFKNVRCLIILIYCYIFRSACLFWSKQATNILKTIKHFLLMVQFHNAPSNFVNLTSRETGIGYQSPQPVSEQWEKKFVFQQNWSDNDAKKNRLQDFYNIFYFHV